MTFIGTLASFPKPGHTIAIAGKTTNNAKHLEIDFLSADSDQNNLILHLCLHLDKQTLTINTKTNGCWFVGHQIKLNHINAGDNFKVTILLMLDEFFISFENGLRCTYPYRSSIDQIGKIRVSADVEYITQLLESRAVSSSLNQQIDSTNEGNSNFVNSIARNFITGDVIVIKGMAYGDDKMSFSISLFEQSSGETVFELSPKVEHKTVVYKGDVVQR